MTTDPIGGIWNFSLNLIHALERTSTQFGLATMGRKLNPGQREQITRLRNVHLFESDFQLEWMEEPWDDVRLAAEWLLDIAADFQPDVIHVNGYAHAALPWNRPVLVAAHSCVYSWFSAVRGLPPPRKSWSLYHHHVRQGLHAAAQITAPTRTMLKTLNIHYGDTFKAGMVIHNGCPPNLFHPGKKEDIILTGGNLLDEAKNIRVLDAVASKTPWPILAAGEQDHSNGGASRLHHLTTLGPLSPELFANYLSRAAIFALPARYEPFGLSALAAGLSGCALVLGDIPSLREVWGDAALYVPPAERAAWAETLQKLIADDPLRVDLAQRALARAQTFTASQMADRYLKTYRSILTTKRKKHENSPLLPIAPVRLEPRERTLSSRLRY